MAGYGDRAVNTVIGSRYARGLALSLAVTVIVSRLIFTLGVCRLLSSDRLDEAITQLLEPDHA